MLAATHSWTPYIMVSALTVSVLSIYIWSRRKKYERVGKVSKLYFYPVKSLKAVEVSEGKCTKLGFEVNGLLDRSFMIVNESGALVSQRNIPSLVLLTPHIAENYLIITSPNGDILRIKIKNLPSPNDQRIKCCIHGDEVTGIDCGDEAASWFESYTKMKGVRLVQFLPMETTRKTPAKSAFYNKLRKKNPAGFQDAQAFHILSQASVDDLSSRLDEKKISALNFRPNILAEGCAPYAEDSWKYTKISDAELELLFFTTRCLLTTNDPETGILSNKEPLVTLRKYRILDKDSKWFKHLGSVPILGTQCGMISAGKIEVGDDIFAIIDKMPKLRK